MVAICEQSPVPLSLVRASALRAGDRVKLESGRYIVVGRSGNAWVLRPASLASVRLPFDRLVVDPVRSHQLPVPRRVEYQGPTGAL